MSDQLQPLGDWLGALAGIESEGTRMANDSRTDGLLVRDYVDGDAAAVARFWNESASSWPSGFSNGVAVSAERIRAGRRTGASINLLLAFERTDGGERLIGYCNLTDDRDGDGKSAYVALLNVHPTALSHGVGKLLLRRSLDRTIELGRDLLYLHTWPGNVRAVPLYKKMGFFWVPETSVRMENYLPTILRQPLTRRFLGDADWYDCFQRELTQRPDEQKHLDRPAYIYAFARDGRRLRWFIDVASRAPFAVESDELSASLRVATKQPVGADGIAALALAGAGGHLISAAFCRGESGLSGSRTVDGGAVPGEFEFALSAAEVADKGRIVADVVCGNETTTLSAGVVVSPRVSVQVEPAPLLRPGQAGSIPIAVTNETEEQLAFTLVLGSSAGFSVEPREVALDLAPRERVSLALRATAERGTHQMAYSVLSPANHRPLQPARRLTVAAVAPGGVCAWQDDAVSVVETSKLRYSAEKGGTVRIVSRETGRPVASPSLVVGPPYGPADPGHHRWSVTSEAAGGQGSLTLVAELTGRPLRVSYTLDVTANDLVTIGITAQNLGTEPAGVNARLATGVAATPAARRIITIPLVRGLVSSSWPDFPDWSNDVFPMSEYAEGWAAITYSERALGDRSVGLAWAEALDVNWGWGGPDLELPLGVIAAGGCESAGPVLLMLGEGDWRSARRTWRSVLAPGAPAATREPVGVVSAECAPLLELSGRAATSIALKSFLSRPQSGQVELDPPIGWRIEPNGFGFERLALLEATSGRFEAEPPTTGPAAVVASGRLRTNLGEWPLAVPFISLGDERCEITFQETTDAGQQVVEVANGWWTFAVGPAFNAGVVRLTRAGVEQVASAFPTPTNRAWSFPWFGGIAPALHSAEDNSRFPADVDPVFGAAPRWSAVRDESHLGARWSGVRLAGESKRRPGLAVGIDYLTAPGSNVLLVVGRLYNRSRARVRGAFDVAAFVAPGGSAEATEVHTLNERGDREVLRRAPLRTFTVGSSDWVAARNPANGETICLVAIGSGARAYGLDWGRDGGHLGCWSDFDLAPGESIEIRGALVVAADLDAARAYRWLATAD